MNDYNQEITKFIQKLVAIPSVNGINNEIEIVEIYVKTALIL